MASAFAHRAGLLAVRVGLAVALVGCEDWPVEPARAPSAAVASSVSPAASASAAAPPLDAAGVEYLVRHVGGANPRARLPLLIVMHGLGDQPESFEGLVDSIPMSARVVLPRGLKRHHDGFSWFDIRIPEPDVEQVSAGVAHAAERVAAAIAVWVERYPTHGKPVVSGFSQGGMLSFALAARHPESISAAVPVAGWLPRPLWPSARPAAAPSIVALHGDADTVLPIEPTRQGVGHLKGIGYDVTLLEYPGVPHRMTSAMNQELLARLGAALQANLPR